ncbi:MAG: YncE family protein [Gemmatimonadetes bacterium]|nr:YncE family protein [Gemmatimonadota bacterium]
MKRSILGSVLACMAAVGLVSTESVAQASTAETGTLVVVNKSESTASIIDIASRRTVATLPTGAGPHEVTLSSDGRWAVVTDYAGGNSLTVIDVSIPAIARTIDLSRYPRPHGIAFLPGDSLVAVTSEASENVVFVHVARGEVVGTVSTGQRGSHMLAVVGSGDVVYTSNGAGTVSELDVPRKARTRVMEVAPQLEAITVTHDGTEVWVGSNSQGTVNVVNTSTGEITHALPNFSWPYRILITPDNAMAIIPDLRNHDIRFFDRATKRELASVDLPGAGPQGLTVGGNGRTLYLSLNRENRIAIMDLETKEITGYIPTGSGPDGIVYSPIVH